VHRHCSKRRPSTMIAAEMLRGLVAVSCLLVPCRSSADEENRQCWDCLERLAMDFPEKNPQEDPFLEDGLSVASSACSTTPFCRRTALRMSANTSTPFRI
jgi:hypothetical protein